MKRDLVLTVIAVTFLAFVGLGYVNHAYEGLRKPTVVSAMQGERNDTAGSQSEKLA